MTPRDQVRGIMADVASDYGVSLEDIASRDRTHRITPARHAVMHRLRQQFGWSQSRIARIWGMDRTTVLNGIRQHDKRMEAGNA